MIIFLIWSIVIINMLLKSHVSIDLLVFNIKYMLGPKIKSYLAAFL